MKIMNTPVQLAQSFPKAGQTVDQKAAQAQKALEDRVAYYEGGGSRPESGNKLQALMVGAMAGAVASAGNCIGGTSLAKSMISEAAAVGTGAAAIGGVVGVALASIGGGGQTGEVLKLAGGFGLGGAAIGTAHAGGAWLIGQALGGSPLAHIAGGAIAGAITGLAVAPSRL